MTTAAPLVEGEFGEGAYGPTIRLSTASADGVSRMKAVFDELAAGQVGMIIALEDRPHFMLRASVWSLRLTVVAKPEEPRLVVSGEGGFLWKGTPEEWETTAELIEPLTRQVGHQYLTSEVTDEAVIELSQGEAPR